MGTYNIKLVIFMGHCIFLIDAFLKLKISIPHCYLINLLRVKVCKILQGGWEGEEISYAYVISIPVFFQCILFVLITSLFGAVSSNFVSMASLCWQHDQCSNNNIPRFLLFMVFRSLQSAFKTIWYVLEINMKRLSQTWKQRRTSERSNNYVNKQRALNVHRHPADNKGKDQQENYSKVGFIEKLMLSLDLWWKGTYPSVFHSRRDLNNQFF